MLYFTGTFHLGTKLIWTLFLLVNSNLYSPDSDYLLETGRWTIPNAIPFEERRCTLCHSLEDEFLFVLECSRYNDLRAIYIYLVITEEGQTCLSWLKYLNPKTRKLR